MHTKFIVDTARAPRAMGPHSQAVGYGALLFVSGQIAVDAHTGKLHPGGVESQTRLVMDNVQGILMGAGLDLSHVLSTTIYLRNLNDFEVVNDVYNLYFDHGAPARSVVEVTRLPQDALIQIDAICAAPANYEALADDLDDGYDDYDPAYGDDGTGPGPDSAEPGMDPTSTEGEDESSPPGSEVVPESEPTPGVDGEGDTKSGDSPEDAATIPGTVPAESSTMVGGWSPLNISKIPPPKSQE